MPSSSTCSNPSRKVRIIARIRGYTDQESVSITQNSLPPSISLYKHSEGESDEKVTVSFGEQPACRKNAFDMDYCYGENENLDLIFGKEVKPLISGVINGKNASIIAFGAIGSGKTYTIQGSEDNPGLATLAMSEILSMAEENGKGNTKLRGISQVPINSIYEFQKLYYGTRKAPKKIGLEVARRSHKGLMIQVLSNSESSDAKLVGKMNFVDLAGYKDARRNSIGCTNPSEIASINKSLYALLNVVNALNANGSHVPYRESKLSRVLQDSFGGSSRVLLLTCLNPICQDAMDTLRMASKSLGNNRVSGSTSSAKPVKNRKLAISTKKETGYVIPLTTHEEAKLPVDCSSALFPDATVDAASSPKKKEESITDVSLEIMDSTSTVEKENSPTPAYNASEDEVVYPLVSDSNFKALSGLEKDGDIIEENKNSQILEERSPPLSARLRDLSNNLKSLYFSTPSGMATQDITTPCSQMSVQEPQTLPGMKQSLVNSCLRFLNTASKNELKGLKGIGEKRANYILELREESPEPFKNLDDLQDIGLSAKQVKGIMKDVAVDLFN